MSKISNTGVHIKLNKIYFFVQFAYGLRRIVFQNLLRISAGVLQPNANALLHMKTIIFTISTKKMVQSYCQKWKRKSLTNFPFKMCNLFGTRSTAIYFICMSIICYLPTLSMAQVDDTEKMFWIEDSILTQQIDTLGSEKVLTDMRNALENAISFCRGNEEFINMDSVDSWVTLVRWAVIMKDRESLDRVRELSDCVSTGDRGHWQYYISYIMRWGVYFDQSENFTQTQKLNLILSNIFHDDEMTIIFYEERLVDLGPEAIPEVIAWAQENLIPRMDELDMFMRSEEDLEFTEQYDRFTTIFAMLFQSQEDKMVLIEMNESGDEKEKLEIIEPNFSIYS